jgi:hypothetical protein
MEADEDDPSVEPSDGVDASPKIVDDARPATSRPSVPAPRGVIATVVAVACGYELVADAINMALDDPVLPSMANGIGRFRGRAFVGRLVPASAGVVLALAGGYVVGLVTRGRFAARR